MTTHFWNQYIISQNITRPLFPLLAGHNKMSRLGRTRRTRVYDCNFDKGESYYRPVLDRLDGKTPVPRATEPDRDRIRADVETRIKSALDDVEGDDLFDSRGARAQRGRPLSSAFDSEELSDDVSVNYLFYLILWHLGPRQSAIL